MTSPTPQPLSPKVREMIRVIGSDAAHQLVAEWGGVRVYIPHRFRQDHPLVQTLGPESGRRLIQHYCGETLSIPRHLYASNKKSQIIDALLTGKPQRVIAREVEVSQRYVEKVAALIRVS